MIDLRHVNKSYLQGDTAFPVLKDINLHIDEGEFVAIMGPSG
ncbi:ABC transporter ATP-binding protein, partial [Lacticaseibacillus paracasei]